MKLENLNSTQIKELQRILGLEITGYYTPLLAAAFKSLQLMLNIYPNGELDDTTNEKIKKRFDVDIIIIREISQDIPQNSKIQHDIAGDIKIPDISTDLSELIKMDIKQYNLPAKEYIATKTKKTMIFLHHTAGWENPYKVVDDWKLDTRGQIGTHYVIGGINFRNHSTQNDGIIVQAVPNDFYAYHLGGKLPSKLTTQSISIEICNFGFLTEKNGKFFNYVGVEVPRQYVITLDKPFRGYKHWHNYTDKQIKSVIELVKKISKDLNINIKTGLPSLCRTNVDVAFELNSSLMQGQANDGVWSHTNVRKDKFDIYPHPVLINELKKL